MSSTLACLGLDVPDDEALVSLLQRTAPRSAEVARSGDVVARRWADASGASLTVARRGDEVIDLVPSLVGPYRARLGALRSFGPYAAADVLDPASAGTGEDDLVSRMVVDVATCLLFPTERSVEAAITALAVDVTVHADDQAFAASDASLLTQSDPSAATADTPRFAAESLLSYGLFGEPDDATPVAFLAGTVVGSETRTNALTDQRFQVAQIRTAGFEAMLCLAADAHEVPPPAGSIVAGSCYLVAELPDAVVPQAEDETAGPRKSPPRRWLRRRG